MQTEGIAGLSPLTPGFSKDLGGKLTFAAKVKDFKVKSESLIWNISPIQIVAISISTIMCVCVCVDSGLHKSNCFEGPLHIFFSNSGGWHSHTMAARAWSQPQNGNQATRGCGQIIDHNLLVTLRERKQ